MKEFIDSLQKSRMGLYDSANSKSVFAYKCVDLSTLSKSGQQIYVKFGKSIRGLIAQVCIPYEANKDMGTTVHYFIKETSAKKLSEDVVFNSQCNGVFANPFDVALEIYTNYQP